MAALALLRNAVESLSACGLRSTAVLRLDASRGAATAAYSAANTNLLNCRRPLFPQSLNCARVSCGGSELCDACRKSCSTFSMLRRTRRCMHTSVGKLNAQMFVHALCIMNVLTGFLLQP